MLVNRQLVCLWPVGNLNPLKFNLNCFFQAFTRPHCSISAINTADYMGKPVVASPYVGCFLRLNIKVLSIKNSHSQRCMPFHRRPKLMLGICFLTRESVSSYKQPFFQAFTRPHCSISAINTAERK